MSPSQRLQKRGLNENLIEISRGTVQICLWVVGCSAIMMSVIQYLRIKEQD